MKRMCDRFGLIEMSPILSLDFWSFEKNRFVLVSGTLKVLAARACFLIVIGFGRWLGNLAWRSCNLLMWYLVRFSTRSRIAGQCNYAILATDLLAREY